MTYLLKPLSIKVRIRIFSSFMEGLEGIVRTTVPHLMNLMRINALDPNVELQMIEHSAQCGKCDVSAVSVPVRRKWHSGIHDDGKTDAGDDSQNVRPIDHLRFRNSVWSVDTVDHQQFIRGVIGVLAHTGGRLRGIHFSHRLGVRTVGCQSIKTGRIVIARRNSQCDT